MKMQDNVKADFRFQRTVHSTFVPYQSRKTSVKDLVLKGDHALYGWLLPIKKLLLLVQSNVTSGNGT